MTALPQDSEGIPIPALRLKDGGAHSISVTGTTARNSTAFSAGTKIVSLYSTVGVFLKFGDSSVEATTGDHYFPAGIYYDVAIGDENVGFFTHVAAIRESTDGTLYLSEKV